MVSIFPRWSDSSCILPKCNYWIHSTAVWCTTMFGLVPSSHTLHCRRWSDCCSAWCRPSFIRWRRTALHQLLCSWCFNFCCCTVTTRWRNHLALHQWCWYMDVIKSAPTECWEDSVYMAWFTLDVSENEQGTISVGEVDILPLNAVRDCGVSYNCFTFFYIFVVLWHLLMRK